MCSLPGYVAVHECVDVLETPRCSCDCAKTSPADLPAAVCQQRLPLYQGYGFVPLENVTLNVDGVAIPCVHLTKHIESAVLL